MKELLKSNIYESAERIVVVGSCLKAMQPKAFQELENLDLPIFEVCLEQSHINMVTTKILGMIRASKIKEIIFATVDKSPHCTQLHYVQDEISKLGIEISSKNYVASDDKLVLVDKSIITLSKNLRELSNQFSKQK